MRPNDTIKEREEQRGRESESLDQIVADIRHDDDATKNEKRLASAILALKESQ